MLANTAVEAVEAVLNENTKGKKRKYTPQERAKIAKYASENGNTAAVWHFNSGFPWIPWWEHCKIIQEAVYKEEA